MQVGSNVRVIDDSYPAAELNTGATGKVTGYCENPDGSRIYAVKIDGHRDCELCPPDSYATAGTLQGGWAYLDDEIEEVTAD